MTELNHPQLSVAIFSSFRKFMPEVTAARSVFMDMGIHVSNPPSVDVINPGAEYVRFPEDDPAMADHEIEGLVFAKARVANAIFIVCPRGYTGPAVAYETGRMAEARRPLYFSDTPSEPFIESLARGRIITAHRLGEMILGGTVTPINLGQ